MRPLVLLLGAGVTLSVHAQEPGAALAATCANCHSTSGRSATQDVSPLAGRPKEFLLAQMKAFKDGSRPATIMHQLAKGYTDAQIEALASYFASQKP